MSKRTITAKQQLLKELELENLSIENLSSAIFSVISSSKEYVLYADYSEEELQDFLNQLDEIPYSKIRDVELFFKNGGYAYQDYDVEIGEYLYFTFPPARD